jgi:hypothetical protein
MAARISSAARRNRGPPRGVLLDQQARLEHVVGLRAEMGTTSAPRRG